MTEIIQHKENTQIAFSGIGTWEYILETNELLFDNQWLNLIGGSNEEVVFHKDFWEDRIHPDDKSLVLETFERFIKNRSNAYKIEYRLRNKKGDYVTVLDLGTVIQRDELSYARHVKICTIDVTAKVLANREKSDEKYRSIFDHLNDAFCEFDFYGNILDFNQNLCNLLEVSESELKETNLQLFFSDKTVKYLYKDLTNIVTNEKVNFETTIVSKRNNLIPVSVNSRLITVAGNGVVQALIRDI